MFRKRPAQDLKRTRRIGQHQHEPVHPTTAPEPPEADPLHQLKPGEGGALASLAVAASLLVGGFRRMRTLMDKLADVPMYFPDDRAEREDELDQAMRDMYDHAKRRKETDEIRAKARRSPGKSAPRTLSLRPSRMKLRLGTQKLRRRHGLGEYSTRRTFDVFTQSYHDVKGRVVDTPQARLNRGAWI